MDDIVKIYASANLCRGVFMLLFTGNVPRGVFCEQSSQKTRELSLRSKRYFLCLSQEGSSFCASRPKEKSHPFFRQDFSVSLFQIISKVISCCISFLIPQSLEQLLSQLQVPARPAVLRLRAAVPESSDKMHLLPSGMQLRHEYCQPWQ